MDPRATNLATVDSDAPAWWTVVAEMHSAGASAHTIAAALNRTPWRAAAGRRWHWREIATLLGSAPRNNLPPRPPQPREESPQLRTQIALHLQAPRGAR